MFEQTYQDFEIIIVDDASTDDTKTLIDSQGDERIRYLRHDARRGAGAARNTGVRVARGRYIAFLDSDDEWFPDKLEEQQRLFSRAPQRVRACCSGYQLHSMETGELNEVIPRSRDSWLQYLLHVGCNLSPGTTLVVDGDVFDEIGHFDESLPRLEDWDWLLRYATQFDLEVIDRPLAHIYHNPDSTTVVAFERSAANFVAKYGCGNLRLPHATVAGIWFDVSQGHARAGHWTNALRYFIRGLLRKPIQRPGMYLLLVDRILGTSMAYAAVSLKKQLLQR